MVPNHTKIKLNIKTDAFCCFLNDEYYFVMIVEWWNQLWLAEFISIKPIPSTTVYSPPRQLGYSGTREDFGSLISCKNWICVAVQTLKSEHVKSWLLGAIIVGYIAGLDIPLSCTNKWVVYLYTA